MRQQATHHPRSSSAVPARRSAIRVLLAAAVLVGGLLGASPSTWAQGQPITFSAVGDVPYSSSEKSEFQEHIDDHDLYSASEFFVHLGDIKAGGTDCVESWYRDMKTSLRSLSVPAFIVPGDNEWNNCSSPSQAWGYWKTHLLAIDQKFCGVPLVERQSVRPENFAFVKNGVLFVGINKPAGGLSGSEISTRLQQDADWISLQLKQKGATVRALVVFAQASPSGSPFESRFRDAAAAFDKPVLYIHGDGHSWIHDEGYLEPNITRVQVDRGSISHPPVQVTVTKDPDNAFLFDRTPWPSGTTPLNRPPCADAGPDRQIPSGSGVTLNGKMSDDGEPIPSQLRVNWSHVSGGGTVQFGNPNAPTTTVQFSADGSYTLRMTVTDGALTASDTVVVGVGVPPNAAPSVTISTPVTGAQFELGQTVIFTGSASDDVDTGLTASLTWTSSINGPLGIGGTVSTSTLSLGEHTITASVTDSGGTTGSQSIIVTIVNTPPDPPSSPTIDVRVASSSDDAEEESATGLVSLTSGDLELVADGSNQTVGLRFNGIAIAKGTTINNAWIQFQTDEASSVATTVTIRGQAADNPTTFTSAAANLSSRPKTTAGVSWSPAAWNTEGAAGTDQRTPNLSSVIQEIVNRPGWSSGHSMAILITGTGKRVAESFDGLESGAPLLHIESDPSVPAPDIDAVPNPYGFGSVLVSTTASGSLNIRNVGAQDLQVSASSLTGADAAQFTITQGSAPFTVAPNATHTLGISFTPASSGSKTASLQLTTNDPDEGSFLVALTGTGTTPTAPDIAVSPTTHNYGTQPIGSSATRVFTVSNTGNVNLVVSAPTLTGPDAASFAFVSGAAGSTVPPAGSSPIEVRFAPTSQGSKSATLTIPSNDPDENPVSISLSGSGVVGGAAPPTFVEVQQGGSAASATVTTSAALTGVNGHLYLAAVSTRGPREVTAMTGLGLAWTRLAAQCSGRNQTNVEIWWARGAATTGTVTATLTSAPTNAVIVVARYSGVAATNPVGVLVGGNTNGANGACASGIDSSAYAFNVTTTQTNSVVFGAVASRNHTHTPGAGYTERVEAVQGTTGGDAVRVSFLDLAVPTAGSLSLNGTLDTATDWALIGVVLRP